ncbi:hypothetical protein AMTR_s00088p00174620 [Amborella trichopoda]|uniref:Uncharacterized protein n=1 Tax=Amborella trichopoda TaxID=13333 RepID=W1NVJ3_AMBTC|nr:hypothetical protein AMTR_s00088p00174620 [Amborella trichopoda]
MGKRQVGGGREERDFIEVKEDIGKNIIPFVLKEDQAVEGFHFEEKLEVPKESFERKRVTELLIILPFRKAADKKREEEDEPRTPSELQGLPIIVLNNNGGGVDHLEMHGVALAIEQQTHVDAFIIWW